MSSYGSGSGSGMRRRVTVRGPVPGTVRDAGQYDPMQAAQSVHRAKTLTRPERYVAPAPLIKPDVDGTAGGPKVMRSYTTVNGVPTLKRGSELWQPWTFVVYMMTFWAPNFMLEAFGKSDPVKRRAWREKVALCELFLIVGAFVGFLTIGLQRTLCPSSDSDKSRWFIRIGTKPNLVGVRGWAMNTTDAKAQNGVDFRVLAAQLSGQDVTDYFNRSHILGNDNFADFSSCRGNDAAFARTTICGYLDQQGQGCALGDLTQDSLENDFALQNTSLRVGYDWERVSNLTNFMVLNGVVLDLRPYMRWNKNPIEGDEVDAAIRYVLQKQDSSFGKDGTRLFFSKPILNDAMPCLTEKYIAGHIDKITPGCFVSQLFLYVSLVIILGIVFARFFMALVFRYMFAPQMVRKPKNLKRQVISPAVLPEGASINPNSTSATAPWVAGVDVSAGAGERSRAVLRRGGQELNPSTPTTAQPMIKLAEIGAELFTACLVTCYSESRAGIKTTLDAIAAADYSDARKLIFVVCDGMVTGDGEKQTTPDICVSMLDSDPRFAAPQAMSYDSVGEPSKIHNMALVYAGHYTQVPGHRTPMIIIAKVGTPQEANEKKPGNRGKRDSQMVLMRFFSRVTFNERMTPLDYDLFRKVHALMGVTPDFFEACLMVDADTRVHDDSIKMLVNSLQNDPMIMGVCGETRISNKRTSWVTMIQVFEYFVSHHQVKAFESVFGGVTCLPGCFSMYRLKARKSNEGDWVPILTSPQVISEYSQGVVSTLHEKNLLLLGEDRFLSTLMLHTFPNRKMMFCPYARCHTQVPDKFKVLLSQRRRWINSTVHNYFELLLVRDLCGTFCISMQFVVFIDLIGTMVLPVAIVLTWYLIISSIISPPSQFADAIPLFLLAAVLGLPGLLSFLMTFKIVYVGWMVIYLLALPVWNFIIPLYSFSKFDDFSWGDTRKIADPHTGAGIIAQDLVTLKQSTARDVPMRRWEDWERSRIRKDHRDAKRKLEFEKRFGKARSKNTDSDDLSLASTEDDRWGMQIGVYAEDLQHVPPPIGLYQVDDSSVDDEELIPSDALELVLAKGWAEGDSDYDGDSTIEMSDKSLSPLPPPSASSHAQDGQNQSLLPHQPHPMRNQHLGPISTYQSVPTGPVSPSGNPSANPVARAYAHNPYSRSYPTPRPANGVAPGNPYGVAPIGIGPSPNVPYASASSVRPNGNTHSKRRSFSNGRI